MRLFFYGTLMDDDLRRMVLGDDLLPKQVVPALVRGFLRVHVAGRSYPMLRPHPTGRVWGQLVSGLTGEAVRRLGLYEGPGYALSAIAVETGEGRGEAMVYLCHSAFDPRPWTLESWRRRYKREIMRQLSLRGWAAAQTRLELCSKPHFSL